MHIAPARIVPPCEYLWVAAARRRLRSLDASIFPSWSLRASRTSVFLFFCVRQTMGYHAGCDFLYRWDVRCWRGLKPFPEKMSLLSAG